MTQLATVVELFTSIVVIVAGLTIFLLFSQDGPQLISNFGGSFFVSCIIFLFLLFHGPKSDLH